MEQNKITELIRSVMTELSDLISCNVNVHPSTMKAWYNTLSDSVIKLEQDNIEPHTPEQPQQFYCADWNRCGATCEEQCPSCNKADNMPPTGCPANIQSNRTNRIPMNPTPTDLIEQAIELLNKTTPSAAYYTIKDLLRTALSEMKEQELPEAIRVLANALKTDEGYRIGWIANIAVSFMNEYDRTAGEKSIHKIANWAAENFINLLCNQSEPIPPTPASVESGEAFDTLTRTIKEHKEPGDRFVVIQDRHYVFNDIVIKAIKNATAILRRENERLKKESEELKKALVLIQKQFNKLANLKS